MTTFDQAISPVDRRQMSVQHEAIANLNFAAAQRLASPCPHADMHLAIMHDRAIAAGVPPTVVAEIINEAVRT